MKTLGVALLGGGARAAYQVGVLTWIAERMPSVAMPLIAGVSAGAANAMALAGLGSLEEAVTRLREEWRRLDPSEIFDTFPSGSEYTFLGVIRELMRRSDGSRGPFQGLFNDKPIRRFVSRCSHFPGIEAQVASGRLKAVALTASSYDTGRSVTFFQGRSGQADWTRDHGIGVAATLTLDHVMASGAIPLLFPPIRIDDRLYADGNVRQQFPLAPLVRLGADRILVIDPGPARRSVETGNESTGSLAETLGMVLDSIVVDRIETDLARLREINELLAAGCGPGGSTFRRPIDSLLIRPAKALGTLAAELGPPRCRTLRLISRASGGWDPRVAGLLSYLWVDRRFTDRLFDLGYQDARERHPELQAFLTQACPESPLQPQLAG